MRITIVRLVLVGLLAATLPAGAATTSELLRCQKGAHTRVLSFAKSAETALFNCALKVETCQLAQALDGDDPTQCLLSATAACGTYSAKIASLKAVSRAKAASVCLSVPLADVNQAVAGLGFFDVSAGCAAASVDDLVTCIFDEAQCAVEHTVFTLDPRAQDAFTAAGIAAAHPCAAP